MYWRKHDGTLTIKYAAKIAGKGGEAMIKMDEIGEIPQLIGNSIAFRDGDSFFLYSQNNKKVAKVSSWNKEVLDQLQKGGFFDALANQITQCGINKASNLMLLLGRDCYMACKYCSVNAGVSNKNMSVELADKAIGLYLDTSPAHPRITLFSGGEPTTNASVIKHVVDKYKGVSWILTTSGAVSRLFLEWLIEKKVTIGFSLDGPPHIQNFLRPLRNGMPSSEIVENNIRAWHKKTGKHATVRTTITSDTILLIDEILDYFDKLCIGTVHLEMLSRIGRAASTDAKLILQPPTSQEWIAVVVKALNWGEKRGKRIKIGALNYFFNPQLSSYCGPMGGQTIVINHEGFLTACSEVVDETSEYWNVFMIGKINQVLKINKEDLGSQYWKYGKACENCFAKYICRGGCAHKNLIKTGNISEPDQQYCQFMKSIIPILIMRIFANK